MMVRVEITDLLNDLAGIMVWSEQRGEWVATLDAGIPREHQQRAIGALCEQAGVDYNPEALPLAS